MIRLRRTKISISVIILLLISIIFTCRKQPYNKKLDNLAPDTFITNVSLKPAGENTIEYNATVLYSGVDRDSRLKYYEFHWGDGQWQRVEAGCTSASKVLSFKTRITEYEFYVRSVDEFDAVDNSPAYQHIDGSMAENKRPEIIVDGPPSGTEISAWLKVNVQANDPAGRVKHIEWKLDSDGVWKKVFLNTEDNSADIELRDMTEGFHTFYAKAVDNFGEESDVQNLTYYVRTGNYFSPFVSIAPMEGPLLLYPLGEPGDWPLVSISADACFYYCEIDYYQYSINDGATWITSLEPVNFKWDSFDRKADEIRLMYKIFDKAGNVAEKTIRYEPAEIICRWGPDILIINGNLYGEMKDTTEVVYTLADGSSTYGSSFVYWEGNSANFNSVNEFLNSNLTDEGIFMAYGDAVPFNLLRLVEVIIGLYDNTEGSLVTYNNTIDNIITCLKMFNYSKVILNAMNFNDHFWKQISSDFGDVGTWYEGSYPIYATEEGKIAGMPEIIYPAGDYSGGIWCVDSNWTGWGNGYTPYLKDANGNICGFSKDDENGLPKWVLLCWKNNNHRFEDTKAIYDAFYKLWGY